MRAKRTFVIAVGAAALASCVTVGQLEQLEPVRRLAFNGSHDDVALCVRQRIGSKVRTHPVGPKYTLYDSVKQSGEGLSHYSITITKTGASSGLAEWRIRQTGDPLPDQAVRAYWTPVEECAARATNPSRS